MNTWFSSDHHFRHKKLSDRRGYSSVEEHDINLLAIWNKYVKPNDTVYYLGDLAWGNTATLTELVKSMHGIFHFCYGNHDQPLKGAINSGNLKRKVVDFKLGKMINIDGQQIWLLHYACRHWPQMHYGSWNLHGHSHGSLPIYEIQGFKLKQFDVGVDCNTQKRPFNYDEIKVIMDQRGLIKVDHHEVKDS